MDHTIFGEIEALQLCGQVSCTAVSVTEGMDRIEIASFKRPSDILLNSSTTLNIWWLHTNVVIGENPISQMASRYKLHKSKKVLIAVELGALNYWSTECIL